MADESELRVLIVDDDAASLESTRTMLSLAGFQVHGANNGAIGLEAVLTFRPDVVVFDFWMPVVNGRELLQSIREVAPGRFGLVAMSGTPEVEDWCGRVGITQFLRKPFARSDLLAAVQRAYDEFRLASVRTRAASPPSSRRAREDRAVMVVGPREVVRPVRSRLREGENPMQVAVVQGLDDAVRALGSFRLDAIAVCGAHDDPMVEALVAEAKVSGLPIIFDRAPREASSLGVHVAPAASAEAVVNLIHEIVAAQRAR